MAKYSKQKRISEESKIALAFLSHLCELEVEEYRESDNTHPGWISYYIKKNHTSGNVQYPKYALAKKFAIDRNWLVAADFNCAITPSGIKAVREFKAEQFEDPLEGTVFERLQNWFLNHKIWAVAILIYCALGSTSGFANSFIQLYDHFKTQSKALTLEPTQDNFSTPEPLSKLRPWWAKD